MTRYMVARPGYPVEPYCVYSKRKWWHLWRHVSCHNTQDDADAAIVTLKTLDTVRAKNDRQR